MRSDPRGLQAREVSFAYGRIPVLQDATLSVAPGETLALAGPNGSGKTTLLKLLAGFLRPSAGSVRLDGRDLAALAPRERARHIAVVPQRASATLTFRVASLVGMGRTPHLGTLGPPTAEDRQAIARALAATEMESLADRRYNELSGGEQQRALLAMALAQDTEYLLLDEPTVHLDLHHQHAMLELLKALHGSRRLAVLAVMHDLNLAALYFDRMAVMDGGRVSAQGKPADVLCRDEVIDVFRAPLTIVPHPKAPVPQVLLEPGDGRV